MGDYLFKETSRDEAIAAAREYSEIAGEAETYSDPEVPGVWAVRLRADGSNAGLAVRADFLVTGPTAEDVEEAEFASWPPTAGGCPVAAGESLSSPGDYGLDATYSPEDNKLRLYAATRLDDETYGRLKEAGYRWAPKQELFRASWTPAREDLALELAGEIGAEETTVEERAAERAERFEGYRENRKRDASSAADAVSELADGIPLGQPILVGHHSEARARRDAKRIERGMERAVRLWDTAAYWRRRAVGVRSSANYKAQPAVGARRIKRLEAETRKSARAGEWARNGLKLWQRDLDVEKAKAVANVDRGVPYGIWSDLSDGKISVDEAREKAVAKHERVLADSERWVAHLALRIVYERELLSAAGESRLLEKPKRPKAPPLLNLSAEGLAVKSLYGRDPEVLPLATLTKAEWKRVHADYRGTRLLAEGPPVRVRTALLRDGAASASIYRVFLSDSKEHDRPEPEAIELGGRTLAVLPAPDAPPAAAARPLPEMNLGALAMQATVDDSKEAALRASLAAGVEAVAAPELFPTPAELADRMVALAELGAGLGGQRVLEPSAGTGAILDAIDRSGSAVSIVAVEVDYRLAEALRERGRPRLRVCCRDFLDVAPRLADGSVNGDLGDFDRVVMNPPFGKAADVRHVLHALQFLRPGGRLVGICAGGPRQEEALRERSWYWEPLPAGTFAGTSVWAALFAIDVEASS